jgi:hypothetical protein
MIGDILRSDPPIIGVAIMAPGLRDAYPQNYGGIALEEALHFYFGVDDGNLLFKVLGVFIPGTTFSEQMRQFFESGCDLQYWNTAPKTP